VGGANDDVVSRRFQSRCIWHPAGMRRSLRQPTGGVRYARPPANGWQASGLAGIS